MKSTSRRSLLSAGAAGLAVYLLDSAPARAESPETATGAETLMVALPGDRYYAVPHSALEPYAVSKEAFDTELNTLWEKKNTVFHGDDSKWLNQGVRSLTADGDKDGNWNRTDGEAAMGVRG